MLSRTCYLCTKEMKEDEELGLVHDQWGTHSCHVKCAKNILGKFVNKAREEAKKSNELLKVDSTLNLILGNWIELHDYNKGDECPICSMHTAAGDPVPYMATVEGETEGGKVILFLECHVCGYILPYPPSTLKPYTQQELIQALEE